MKTREAAEAYIAEEYPNYEYNEKLKLWVNQKSKRYKINIIEEKFDG